MRRVWVPTIIITVDIRPIMHQVRNFVVNYGIIHVAAVPGVFCDVARPIRRDFVSNTTLLICPEGDHVEDRTRIAIFPCVKTSIIPYDTVARTMKFHERYRTGDSIWSAGW